MYIPIDKFQMVPRAIPSNFGKVNPTGSYGITRDISYIVVAWATRAWPTYSHVRRHCSACGHSIQEGPSEFHKILLDYMYTYVIVRHSDVRVTVSYFNVNRVEGIIYTYNDVT